MSQGHRVTVQSGAGTLASFPDEAFAGAGAELADAAAAFSAELVLKVQSPTNAELPLLKRGATLVGMLDPFNAENAAQLAASGRHRVRARSRAAHDARAKPRCAVVAGEHRRL